MKDDDSGADRWSFMSSLSDCFVILLAELMVRVEGTFETSLAIVGVVLLLVLYLLGLRIEQGFNKE